MAPASSPVAVPLRLPVRVSFTAQVPIAKLAELPNVDPVTFWKRADALLLVVRAPLASGAVTWPTDSNPLRTPVCDARFAIASPVRLVYASLQMPSLLMTGTIGMLLSTEVPLPVRIAIGLKHPSG